MASGNAGKLNEIAKLLAPLNIVVVPQAELGVSNVDENGVTFEENAILKAKNASDATGLAAIADDSGLMVDALGGRPGVYSARYAGRNATDDDNIDKLMLELAGIADDARTAAFHCAVCYVSPHGGDTITTHGVWGGRILTERRGDGGFGYDPVFVDTDTGLTSAELTPAQKNARSHRGQALRELIEILHGRNLRSK